MSASPLRRLASAFSGVSLMITIGSSAWSGCVAHHVEERLAHVEDRTIEHERIGVMLGDEFVDDARV